MFNIPALILDQVHYNNIHTWDASTLSSICIVRKNEGISMMQYIFATLDRRDDDTYHQDR